MALFADLLGSYPGSPQARAGWSEPSWPAPHWIAASWERPREFFAALVAEAEYALGGPAKSQLETGIDFYADAVLRHLQRDARSPVLRWYDTGTGWQTLSWSELDAQAAALASVLVAAGAQPGERLALVLPSGAPLLVGLMAAFYVGCCAVPILPLGSTYVQRALTLSEARRVVTCSPYTALRGLMAHKPLLLSEKLLAQAGRRPPTATYAPEAPALLVASPLRAAGALTKVTAAAAYGAALRDGLMLFGLRPGDMLVAPPAPQYLPVIHLAALLCGAGLIEPSAAGVRHAPSGLLGLVARAVVLTRSVRDALAETSTGPLPWGSWFSDPQEGFDLAGWERAEQRLRLSSIPHASLLWDAASGGAVLVAEPRRGPPQPYLTPAPGCRHTFAALYGDGPAVTDVGRLVLLAEDLSPAGSPGEAVLLRTESGYMYGGSAQPRRAGWAYPIADALAVLQSAKELAVVVGASVIELAGSGQSAHAVIVIVLFSGLQPAEEVLRPECLALLDRELGPEACPDRIEVFPLYPRRQPRRPDAAVDAEWVRAQYESGELYKKARSPLFRSLTRLRAALHAAAGG